MEKLNKLIFNGEEYLPKKVLLKWIREISDAVNSFSDRGDPIRAQGANKVISLILEKVDAPQEYWKPSEEQQEVDLEEEMRKERRQQLEDGTTLML